MDDATLTALKGSIAHWEKVKANPMRQVGPNDCPLCQLFFFDGNWCSGCPIMEKTGERTCKGTPYMDFVSRRTHEAAAAELDFLRSLLPTSPQETEAAGR